MLHSRCVDTCSCLPIPIISLFLLNSWTKCTNLLINFSSQLQALAWYRVTAHSILTADMGICTSRRSSSLDGASFISSLSTNARNSELITYNSNVTLFFPHFLPPFFYAYSETFQLFSKPWTYAFSNVIFYSCRFPFCSLCFQKNCLGVHMKPHLKATLRHIQWQATVKKPSAALQFPSFEIGFFWFLWKEKSCQFSLFRGLNLLKGDKRSFFTRRIFTKVVFRLFFVGGPFWRPSW